nr:MAG: major capsid protein [Microvirus sp.]
MSIFNKVASPKLKRSTFDLSHTRKLSMKIGELVPVLVQEVVPGDRFEISTESMIRLAPLTAPVMHRMNSTIHYFFVPNRILWDKWEDFITGNEQITLPLVKHYYAAAGSLQDHLGLPTGHGFEDAATDINSLPFRAYHKIWNDFYRDANLEEEYDLDDPYIVNQPLRVRAWEKDYFTSALTNPQKGNAVSIDGKLNYMQSSHVFTNTGETPALGSHIKTSLVPNYDDSLLLQDGEPTSLRIENVESVSIDVEDLRLATRLQRWLERNARAGTRYAEHLLAHWGVYTKDSRLQRAEYLGGGKTPVVISEVPNTTGTVDAPQGTLAGNGLSIGKSNQATKFVEEHGYIMAIMSVIPETAYFQGIPRMFDRKLNLDFYYPEFAQLGEQEIKNQEIFMTDDPAVNEATFGYQSRFAEYKYAPSTVHGEFRETLKFWHMARHFDELPLLNDNFIKADAIDDPLSPAGPWRIFAVNEAEQLYVQLYHQIKATRPMPFLNDPTL